MSIKTHAYTAATTLAVAATVSLGAVSAAHSPAASVQRATVTNVAVKQQPMSAWMKRPCAEEDSVNCFWDAGSRGNKSGHSFYVRQFPGRAHMVCVMYVKLRDARRWDYCEATR